MREATRPGITRLDLITPKEREILRINRILTMWHAYGMNSATSAQIQELRASNEAAAEVYRLQKAREIQQS